MGSEKILFVIDIIGIVAFSLTGAIMAIRKGLDLFGVNIVAIMNSVGGGCIRDLMLGNTPPVMLTKTAYIAVTCICASTVFFIMYFHFGSSKTNNKEALEIYEIVIFIFDTLGLASFTMGGMLTAYNTLPEASGFIAVFMGVLTGIGGGIIRDITLGKLPEVFVKHIYALASMAGAIIASIMFKTMDATLSIVTGFFLIFVIRCLAAKFEWDLPVVKTN